MARSSRLLLPTAWRYQQALFYVLPLPTPCYRTTIYVVDVALWVCVYLGTHRLAGPPLVCRGCGCGRTGAGCYTPDCFTAPRTTGLNASRFYRRPMLHSLPTSVIPPPPYCSWLCGCVGLPTTTLPSSTRGPLYHTAMPPDHHLLNPVVFIGSVLRPVPRAYDIPACVLRRCLRRDV